MDANFSLLENWKVLTGIGIFFVVCVFFTVNFVRNSVKKTKRIEVTANDGSAASGGDMNGTININNTTNTKN
ncbi:hypothetical protein AO891_23510 [Pseudomonas aeruginosa]|nr:hypothetical protein AO891_23510 [Pseudomonas aeruginosa]KSL07474.1 hypothetical protein APA45_30470 [Pseudomonas aeruginosa]